MEFDLDKCAKESFKRSKFVQTIAIELNKETNSELELEEVYKYHGINEGQEIQHVTMKEKIRKVCVLRVINKSELNAKNNFEVINSLGLTVVTNSISNRWPYWGRSLTPLQRCS